MSDESFLNIEVQDISDEEASLITDSPLWQTLSDRQQGTIQGGMLDAFTRVVSQSDALEAPVAKVEANQFSTTTKLVGEAIF